MKNRTMFATVLALFLVVSLSFAQMPEKPPMPPAKPHGIMGIPDLTADQIQQIQKLKLQHQKEMLPLKTELKAKRLELKSLILENADQKKIDAKIDDIGKAMTKLMKKKVAHRMAIRKLLTEDQKVYFDARPFLMPKEGFMGRPGPHKREGRCGGPHHWR